MTNLSDPIFHDADKARKHFETIRWPNERHCTHCEGTSTVFVKGKKHRPGLYYCNDCKKTFTVTVGTVIERSKIPLNKWALGFHLMAASKKGMSAHQLHRMLGVTYKTAWFMTHRIREAMRDEKPTPMGGEGKTIETDETYQGRTEEGPQDVFTSGKGWTRTRGNRPVVALVERGGEVRSFHVDSADAYTIRNILRINARRNSKLMTDKSNIYIYTYIGKEYASHDTVKHSVKEYVRGDAYTNTIEGFFSIFKRGMKGIYQHCGEKHLHRYLSEFDFRYNARKISDTERTARAIFCISGKRLMYRPTS